MLLTKGNPMDQFGCQATIAIPYTQIVIEQYLCAYNILMCLCTFMYVSVCPKNLHCNTHCYSAYEASYQRNDAKMIETIQPYSFDTEIHTFWSFFDFYGNYLSPDIYYIYAMSISNIFT